MAGQAWSITIVPGTNGASFVPDVYIPPDQTKPVALQAGNGDLISWNNQTDQEHEIWQTGGDRITEPIAPRQSSFPAYVIALPNNETTGAVSYYCSYHPEETGTIDVV